MLTTLWAQLLLPDQTTLNFGIDITEQRKTEKILKTRASIDGLTQCFNRDEILHQLEQLLEDSQNQQQLLPFVSLCWIWIISKTLMILGGIWQVMNP
jgi:hypothetical protein